MIALGPEEWQAVRLSLQVALTATLVSLPFAIAIAWLLERRQFWGRDVLSGIVHLPLVLPPVVTGFGLLLLFGRQGVIGAPLFDHFGVTLAFRWTGAALAAAIMGFPLMVRAIRLSIAAIHPDLTAAAASLGAHPVRVFCTITLPLSLPGVLGGAVLGFAKALGEFGATITFVSAIPGETQTLPSAIYALLQIPGAEGAAFNLVLISVILAVGALLLSELLARALSARLEGRA